MLALRSTPAGTGLTLPLTTAYSDQPVSPLTSVPSGSRALRLATTWPAEPDRMTSPGWMAGK